MSDAEYYVRYCVHLLQSKWKLVFLFLGFTLFFTCLNFPESAASAYKVVFDAGSTGTRVHVFRFNAIQSFRSENLVLLEIPLFAKFQGGLSDHAHAPAGCRTGLLKLLEEAKAVVPISEWGRTELIFMATAGLRLLPAEQAEALLTEARSVLSSHSEFRVSTVDTIDGKLEAKLIYVMAQFVFKNPIAIVDLGGGSVQLAYKTSLPATSAASSLNLKVPHTVPALLAGVWLGRFPSKSTGNAHVGSPPSLRPRVDSLRHCLPLRRHRGPSDSAEGGHRQAVCRCSRFGAGVVRGVSTVQAHSELRRYVWTERAMAGSLEQHSRMAPLFIHIRHCLGGGHGACR